MAILSIATTKGGSGKTTAALCLADHWHRAGHTVQCLDTDPNRNLTIWLGSIGNPIPCEAVGEDEVVDAAIAAEQAADIVVIDVAGVLGKALVYAIGVSSAVVIPTKPGRLDILEAGRTQQHIESAIKQLRRRQPDAGIAYAALLMQTGRRATVTAHSRTELAGLGIPTLTADLAHRTAYQQASFQGLPLDDAAVTRDVAAVAAELEQLMEGR